jgi:hypothetical protein
MIFRFSVANFSERSKVERHQLKFICGVVSTSKVDVKKMAYLLFSVWPIPRSLSIPCPSLQQGRTEKNREEQRRTEKNGEEQMEV